MQNTFSKLSNICILMTGVIVLTTYCGNEQELPAAADLSVPSTSSGPLESQNIQLEGIAPSASMGDKVCFDINANFNCDEGEPSTFVTSQKYYSLLVNSGFLNIFSRVLVESSVPGTSAKLPMVSVPTHNGYVSGLTTLVTLALEKVGQLNIANIDEEIGKAENDVRNLFDIENTVTIIPPRFEGSDNKLISTFLGNLPSNDTTTGSILTEIQQWHDSIPQKPAVVSDSIVKVAGASIALPVGLIAYSTFRAGKLAYELVTSGNIEPSLKCTKRLSGCSQQDAYNYEECQIGGAFGCIYRNKTMKEECFVDDTDCLCKKYKWGTKRPQDCNDSATSTQISLSLSGTENFNGLSSSSTFAEALEYFQNNSSDPALTRANLVRSLYESIDTVEINEQFETPSVFSSLVSGLTTILAHFDGYYENLSAWQRERAEHIASYNVALSNSLYNDLPNSMIEENITFTNTVNPFDSLPYHTLESKQVSFADLSNDITFEAQFRHGRLVDYKVSGEKIAGYYLDLENLTNGWQSLGTSISSTENLTSTCLIPATCSSGGKITFKIPENAKIAGSTYLIKLVLLGDKSEAVGIIRIQSAVE